MQAGDVTIIVFLYVVIILLIDCLDRDKQMSGIACLGVDQTQVSKRWGSTRPNLSESGAISVLGLRLV